MDIAKYIGLFLLKNQYCYVHGLGNMELKKLRAAHDGTALQAPSYEVIVTPGGSIDDNLANFIATNEQTSISKAANTLREYSVQVRKDLAAGKDVIIPNIGKFVEENGKIRFETDAHFAYKPAGIPTIKNSKQLDEQNTRLSHKPSYPAPAKADSVNWSMVILVVVLILIVAGGGYYIYYSTQNNEEVATAPVADTTAPEPIPAADIAAPNVDTVDASAPLNADSSAINDYKIIIGKYQTRERAEKRVNNLTLNGNKVDLVPKDSTGYLVVTTISCPATDTTRVKDSLRIMFGYKDVMILR